MSELARPEATRRSFVIVRDKVATANYRMTLSSAMVNCQVPYISRAF